MMANEKKTVFLTIGTGVVARNFLCNRFFEKLKEKYRVVIFTPLYNDPDFIKRFGGDNVHFEKLKKRRLTRRELFLIALHKALIYNESVKIKSFYSLSSTMRQKRTLWKITKNYIELIVFGGVLSKIPVLRSWLKAIDRKIYNAEYYEDEYAKYKPNLLFITNMGADDEVYLLRSAIRRNIPNVGMTKSWDNFSKIGFREFVEKVIVWSEYMRDEVTRFQRYKEKDVEIIGIPQFDVLYDVKNTHSREDFIKTYGLNPNRKTILFGQSNPLLCPDDAYVCEILRDWIVGQDDKYQLLIRPHFRHKDAEKPFLHLVDNKNVYIDLQNEASNFATGAWDLSMESQIRRALSLRYSDVVINAASTLVLDTAVAGTPFIAYAFDKDKNLPYAMSLKRIYDLLWYLDLKEHGFGKLVVNDEKELIDRTRGFLEKNIKEVPDVYPELIRRFCHKADGKAGERLFDFIDRYIHRS